MAFVDPNEQTPAVAAPAGQQAPISAGGAGVGGATKKADATPGVNVPQQPSAQLSAYLNANQPQTTAFAGNVANTLSNQTQAAGNAIAPAVNAYTGNLYTVPTDTTVNQQVATAPSQLTPEQKQTYQTELGAAAKVQNSANTFESTSGYQNLAGDIQKAVEQANLWNSGNNIPNLTTAVQPFESPTATSGDKTLDALLLSQTPGAYKQITGAVAPAANLQGNLAAGTAQADQALQDAIAQDQAATAAAQAAPQAFANNLTNYLTNAVGQATTTATAQNQQIMADLAANTPTPDDLQTLGITADQWASLSSDMAAANSVGAPISLSNYLNQAPTSAINAQTLATPENYADVAALAGLLGGNAPVEPISATTANEAGTAPTSFNKFDFAGADTQAKANNLIGTAKAIQGQEKSAEAAYPINHFGGQSPEQFNSYIQTLNAQLASINQQLQALASGANFSLDPGVPWTPESGPTIPQASMEEWALPPLAISQDILSGLSSLFSEGGEVPKRQNLKQYLGA